MTKVNYMDSLKMYLSSWDAFRWTTLEQHFLFKNHFLSQRFLVECLPQICQKCKRKFSLKNYISHTCIFISILNQHTAEIEKVYNSPYTTAMLKSCYLKS